MSNHLQTSIPEPQMTLESLHQSVMALKEAVENLIGQRGTDETTAATSTTVADLDTTLRALIAEPIDNSNWDPDGDPLAVANGGTGAGTAANARTNLSAQETLSGLTISTATVATGDKVLIQDTDDSDNLKTVTAQAIANLAPAELPTQTGNSGKLLTTDGSNPSWSASSAVFARAAITAMTGTPVISGGVNTSTATRNSTGNYTITFTNAAADVNYTVVATPTIAGATSDIIIQYIAKSTGSFVVHVRRGANGALTDISAFDFVCFTSV